MEHEDPSGERVNDFPRAPTAWLLLAMVFTILVGLTLTQARAPSVASSKRPYLEQEAAIRVAMKQKSLAALVNSWTGSTSLRSFGAVDDETMQSLAASAPKDLKAARLYIAARFESGLEVSGKDLTLLSGARDKSDDGFRKIYEAKKLTPEAAKALSAPFPEKDFAYNLARVHAFDKAGDPSPRRALSPAWKAFGVLIMLLGLVVALPLGVMMWAIYFHFRSLGRLVPKGHPAEPLTLGEADRFAYRAVLLIGTFLTINLFFSMIPDLPTPLKLFMSFGTMATAVAALHRIPVLGLSLPLHRVGFKRDNVVRDVLWGIGGYLASLPCVLTAALIGQQLMKHFDKSSHPATELMESSPTAGTVLALLFAAAIVAPFWEEIMFRGTLLPALAKVLGRPVWAILASSFLFAAIHPQGPPLWLGLGFIGAMNCMLAYQTRSLIPSMVLHLLNNAVILLFTVFLF